MVTNHVDPAVWAKLHSIVRAKLRKDGFMPTPGPVGAKAAATSSSKKPKKLSALPDLTEALWKRWVCHSQISSKLDGWQARLEQRGYRFNTRPCRIHNLAHAEWNIRSGPSEDPSVLA